MKCTCPGRSYGAHMGRRMPAYVCSWPIVSCRSGFNAGNVTSGGSGPKAPHLSQNSSKTMCVGPWHLEKWDFLMFLEKFLRITFQFLLVFIFNWISLVIMQYVIYLYWQIDFKRNILYLSLFLYRNQSWKIPVKFQRIRFVSIIPMKYMY